MVVTTSEARDLGELQGSVWLFGGAYSNLQALEAFLALAKKEGIHPANIIHTGDVVAYCAQPRETSELLRSSGVHCLLGNCEESVGEGKLDCGCGFAEDSTCNRYSVNWYAHVMRELKGREDLAQWMGSLSRRIEFTFAGRRFAVVHGSPRKISEFIWPSTPESELRDAMSHLPDGGKSIDAIIGGHSGIPFARLFSSGACTKLWLNAGVIGMPANDGTQRVWFSVLKAGADGSLEVNLRSFSYDAKAAAEAIFAEGRLVRGYADALLSGVWPSHDILPLEEQMATGQALQEKLVVWPARRSTLSLRRSISQQIMPPKELLLSAGLMLVFALACAAAVSARKRAERSH